MSTTTGTSTVRAAPRRPCWIRDLGLYLELSKARLSSLVVVTTSAGFVLAARGEPDWNRFLWTLAGTLCAAWGANALNQVVERRRDALMERTRRRPLPSYGLTVRKSLLWAGTTAAAGPLLLAWFVGPLPALLAAAAEALYVLVYTPLKVRTPLCTLAGAVVGAIPPVIGWTAAVGRVDPGAWILATLLFVWQVPHFLALGWMYRADYERGGFRMLPSVDRTGALTARIAVVYTLALLPVGIAAAWTGLAGWWYGAGSVVLGTLFLAAAVRLFHERNETGARRLFLAGVAYLPLLLGLMILDPARPRDAGDSGHAGISRAEDAVPAARSHGRATVPGGKPPASFF